MKGRLRLLVAVAFGLPTLASAQAAPATARQCEPDQSTPQFVARSWFSMSRAIAAINSNADARKDLIDALRILSDPKAKDRDKNLTGQRYTLGQAYVLLLGQGVAAVIKRADIGIQSSPDQTIDLLLAADSVFTAVEQAMPECVDLVRQWRQQKPWLDMLNAAITAVNANQLDSAETFARRSLILERRAPYAYAVLGNVARARHADSAAVTFFRQALELAGTDTVYADVRAKTLGDLARLLADRAAAAPVAQRRALAREALTAYETLLRESQPDDFSRGFAISQLANLYIVSGDSVHVRNAYASVITDPTKYGERALLEAGMVATRAGASRDAAKLFGAVAAANPYQRDALNNLAASYVGTGEYPKVFPIVTRLVEMDPNNPDNYLLNAYAYGGLVKNAKEARLRQAYTDSLIRYNNLSEQIISRVTFAEFTRLRSEVRLRGTIENGGRVPKSYNLTVELIGANGATADTKTLTVGPVAAGARGEFRITFAVPGEPILGFRYKRVN